MKLLKPIIFLLISIFFAFCSNLFGQKLEPKERILEADHTISSKIMKIDYQLYISFPDSYSSQDTISYPVLYVLDGKYMFSITNGTRVNLDFENKIEDVIIVGIGSGIDDQSWQINRTFEYTPSQDATVKLQSGGAEFFLECIKTEIMPFVDTHYKTNSDNGIIGHSLGGLFVSYCFLNATGSFSRYGISSPSLMWKNNEILNQAELLFTKNKSWDIPFTKVFISVGGKEEQEMVSGMIKFSTLLKDRNYENLELSWNTFDNETHLSVVSAMISRTLSVLYKKNH